MIDYGLEYAYKHNIGGFKDYVDGVACHNNPSLFKLGGILNDSFDEQVYTSLTNNTKMFKLTYKAKVKDSKKTVYNEIITNDNLFM